MAGSAMTRSQAVFVRDLVLLKGLGISKKKDISSIFHMLKGHLDKLLFHN
jgi:hypothetical protein